jgi:hypothetical protein
MNIRETFALREQNGKESGIKTGETGKKTGKAIVGSGSSVAAGY